MDLSIRSPTFFISKTFLAPNSDGLSFGLLKRRAHGLWSRVSYTKGLGDIKTQSSKVDCLQRLFRKREEGEAGRVHALPSPAEAAGGRLLWGLSPCWKDGESVTPFRTLLLIPFSTVIAPEKHF